MGQPEQNKSSGCSNLISGAILLFLAYQFFVVPAISDNQETDTLTIQQPSAVVKDPINPQLNVTDETTTDGVTIAEAEPSQSGERALVQTQPPSANIEFTGAVHAPIESAKFIERHFTWEYLVAWDWDVTIPEAIYEYYRKMPRPLTNNYSVYVTHPLDDLYIGKLVKVIEESAIKSGLDEYQTVELAIAFVQSLPYSLDSVTSPFDEYPRYPIETLVDGGGDCEDTAILLASLLHEMGYGVVLLGFPDHMGVGVKGRENIYGTYWTLDEDKYFYVETTGIGWHVGQLPEEYEGINAKILTLKQVPIITHEWNLTAEGIFAVLKVKVDNLGTAPASNIYVYTGFDAGDGTGYSLKQSEYFNLEPGGRVIATLRLLPPPSGKRIRLLVRIIMGEYLVDESYSIWIDT